ncbi:hypothetical protein [Saccharopolyspora taberi]|uniref:Anti-sigma factor n=1 Tax=Saccharopolyspora taberi TaxID=60895 RepID=A0ABN3VNY0_9PSEU
MSGEERRSGAPQGPPWSLDLLADFHAGVLDQETSDRVRVQIQEDPEAREVLAALDATTSDLSDLPPLTIPDDVSAQIDAALAAEVKAWSAETAEPQAQVVDFAAAKQRRRRRFTLGAGVLAAAAAVAGIVVFSSGLVGPGDTNSAQPPAGTPSGPPPLAFQGEVRLEGQEFSEALDKPQYISSLADPKQLVGCLQANGVRSGNPMGAREVTLDGKPGQLLILQGGGIGRFRLLTVGPDCGPGNPAVMSDTTIGG